MEKETIPGLENGVGYRNSTPTNVIIAKSKVMFLRNRAKFLAKNFVIRILKYGPMILRKSLDDLERVENLNCHRTKQNEYPGVRLEGS